MTYDADTITTFLRTELDQIADRLVEFGTAPETNRLAAIAWTLRSTAPGTADALVDPAGTEISRLRAFAIAASLVPGLSSAEQAHLAASLDPTPIARAAA